MTESVIEFTGIGPDNLEMIPAELIARRRCTQCLHYEDPTFWTGSDPDAILETKKRAWFERVGGTFGVCGHVAREDGRTVAFAEYAMPSDFPGLAEYDIQPDAALPLIVCLVVAQDARDQGVGAKLVGEVEQSLRARGHKGVQALARKEGRGTCGPMSFWTHLGYTLKAEWEDFAVVAREL